MKANTLVPLIVALTMGLAAALLAHHALSRKPSGSGPAPATVPVVVAKAAVSPGHEFVADELTVMHTVGNSAPDGAFTDPAQIVGRVGAVAFVPGQPVLETMLAARGTAPGLTAMIPTGMRAITLDISESAGLAGLLNPGCRVDVLATATDSNSADRSLSRILVEDAPVIAIGQRTGISAPEAAKDAAAPPMPRTATLLVNARDAEVLDLAQSLARIRLVLRGASDHDASDEDAVTLADLRGSASAVLPVMATTPVVTVQPVAASQPAPTTQPVPTYVAPSSHRIVTLILGNTEQRFSFREQPKASDSEVSDTNDPADSKDPFAKPLSN
jgi:pilus assembly protein CpaB